MMSDGETFECSSQEATLQDTSARVAMRDWGCAGRVDSPDGGQQCFDTPSAVFALSTFQVEVESRALERAVRGCEYAWTADVSGDRHLGRRA